jgi:hypothetical protein
VLAKRVALDGSGNAYIVGNVSSMSSIPTRNPFQGTFGGAFDAFVTKLNPSGTDIVYSTYLGGTGIDGGDGIAVDTSGEAFVAGYTLSKDFPGIVSPATFQGYGAFVVKLSADGSGLLYSHVDQSPRLTHAHSVAIDGAGDAWYTGDASPGAGSSAMFINELDPMGI